MIGNNKRRIRDQSPLSRDAVAIGTNLRHGDCGFTITLDPCPGQNARSIQLNAVEGLTECAVMCEAGFRGVGVGVYSCPITGGDAESNFECVEMTCQDDGVYCGEHAFCENADNLRTAGYRCSCAEGFIGDSVWNGPATCRELTCSDSTASCGENAVCDDGNINRYLHIGNGPCGKLGDDTIEENLVHSTTRDSSDPNNCKETCDRDILCTGFSTNRKGCVLYHNVTITKIDAQGSTRYVSIDQNECPSTHVEIDSSDECLHESATFLGLNEVDYNAYSDDSSRKGCVLIDGVLKFNEHETGGNNGTRICVLDSGLHCYEKDNEGSWMMAEIGESCLDACGSGRCGRSEQSEIRDHAALLEIFPSECSKYDSSSSDVTVSLPFFRDVESGCAPFPDDKFRQGARSTCNETAPDQARRLCFCKQPQEHGFRCRCEDGFDGITNWNAPAYCTPQDCTEAPFVPNGNNLDCSGAVAHEYACTVTCDPGFEMIGSSSVTCLNGQYPNLPECVASNCTWICEAREKREYDSLYIIIKRLYQFYHSSIISRVKNHSDVKKREYDSLTTLLSREFINSITHLSYHVEKIIRTLALEHRYGNTECRQCVEFVGLHRYK